MNVELLFVDSFEFRLILLLHSRSLTYPNSIVLFVFLIFFFELWYRRLFLPILFYARNRFFLSSFSSSPFHCNRTLVLSEKSSFINRDEHLFHFTGIFANTFV